MCVRPFLSAYIYFLSFTWIYPTLLAHIQINKKATALAVASLYELTKLSRKVSTLFLCATYRVATGKKITIYLLWLIVHKRNILVSIAYHSDKIVWSKTLFCHSVFPYAAYSVATLRNSFRGVPSPNTHSKDLHPAWLSSHLVAPPSKGLFVNGAKAQITLPDCPVPSRHTVSVYLFRHVSTTKPQPRLKSIVLCRLFFLPSSRQLAQ